MAIATLLSVSGAPGVTTLSVAAALTWRRASILLEADTSKASSVLPGFLRGQVDHSRGLTPLSIAQQRGSLTSSAVLEQAIELAQDRFFVAGFSNPAAGAGATALWSQLGTTLAAFESAGTDVVVDLGRYTPKDNRQALLQVADSVLLVTGTQLPDIAAAANRVPEIKALLTAAGHGNYLGIVLVRRGIEDYSRAEIEKVLGAPVVGEIPDDAKTAATYSLGTSASSRQERSPFRRSLSAALATITQQIDERRAQLGARPTAPQEVLA